MVEMILFLIKLMSCSNIMLGIDPDVQDVCVGESVAKVAAKSLYEQLICIIVLYLYSIEQNNSIYFSYCY